jgi:hypothetical protein
MKMRISEKRDTLRSLLATGIALTLLAAPINTQAETISFLVDPATFDANTDGFIMGDEFSPVGSDGTVFSLVPTVNLVGFPRLLLSLTNGLIFGGGGGSTLSFDFTADHTIELDSYTLSSNFLFLGNPVFDIREGATILSVSNTAINSGDTHSFAGGPILIEAGTTYTFIATTTGAAIQSFMASWQYHAVPAPASFALLTLGLGCIPRRRRP